jgi:hypothetical protein
VWINSWLKTSFAYNCILYSRIGLILIFAIIHVIVVAPGFKLSWKYTLIVHAGIQDGYIIHTQFCFEYIAVKLSVKLHEFCEAYNFLFIVLQNQADILFARRWCQKSLAYKCPRYQVNLWTIATRRLQAI